MRILLTNNTLADFAGSELYIKDMAHGLLLRGHKPIAYSTMLGPLAEELRRLTIPVVDDLSQISEAPDIIHGQHHLDTMTALLHFPQVPVISFCHGWLPWEAIPVKTSRVLRYVAVDLTCRDRLIYEHGIPQSRIEVIYNFADTKRFAARGPLPSKAKRALVFGNSARRNAPHVLAVRDACAALDISLECMEDIETQVVTSRPEQFLANYDVVFAKARCAIEALAVGCAVIPCDAVGAGPLVTMANLPELRGANFGIRTLSQPHSVRHFREQLQLYNAEDATQISAWMRKNASQDEAIDHVIRLYESVLAEHKQQAPADDAEQLQQTSEYLRSLAPRIKRIHVLQSEYRNREIEVEALQKNLAAVAASEEQLQQRLSQSTAERERSEAATARLEQSLAEAHQLHQEQAEKNRLLEQENQTLREAILGFTQSAGVLLQKRVNGIPVVGSLARHAFHLLKPKAAPRDGV